MAKDNKVPPPTRLFAELSEETLRHLEDIGGELDEATGDLDALDELGMDTSRMRDRVAWAKKAREVILQRFGPKKP